MKFKKPSEQNVTSTAVMTGGAIVGGMVSRGAFGALHSPTNAADDATKKKEENTALMKRGALIIAGVALAMCVDGNDTGANAVKGAGVGMAVAQGLEVIKTLAERNGVANASAATSKTKKFVANSLGLGCPCNEQPQMGMGFPQIERVYTPRFSYEVAQEAAMAATSPDMVYEHPLVIAVRSRNAA